MRRGGARAEHLRMARPCLPQAARCRTELLLPHQARCMPLFVAAAVGDLHGDWQKAIDSFRAAGVITVSEDEIVWSGGDTVVVQLGDVLDRGDYEIGAGGRPGCGVLAPPPTHALPRSAAWNRERKQHSLWHSPSTLAMAGDAIAARPPGQPPRRPPDPPAACVVMVCPQPSSTCSGG